MRDLICDVIDDCTWRCDT